MKKFKDLVQSLDEVKKFKLPRGEQEIDSYMEKGAKGKKVPVVIAKKSNKFKVYVDGQELAQYKNEKEARKNAKELIKLLGEDLSDFIEEVLEEPKIEDTLGFSNGLRGNQTYDDVAKKIANIESVLVNEEVPPAFVKKYASMRMSLAVIKRNIEKELKFRPDPKKVEAMKDKLAKTREAMKAMVDKFGSGVTKGDDHQQGGY
tara:strand:+ start:1297 stop:1905 length:609 start_codon:yes stop_codon:yes gene_type:complete